MTELFESNWYTQGLMTPFDKFKRGFTIRYKQVVEKGNIVILIGKCMSIDKDKTYLMKCWFNAFGGGHSKPVELPEDLKEGTVGKNEGYYTIAPELYKKLKKRSIKHTGQLDD